MRRFAWRWLMLPSLLIGLITCASLTKPPHGFAVLTPGVISLPFLLKRQLRVVLQPVAAMLCASRPGTFGIVRLKWSLCSGCEALNDSPVPGFMAVSLSCV